jgi:predicted AAA+ superfamily ATPase
MVQQYSSLLRGERSESLVEQALALIAKTGQIVKSFSRTKSYSIEDKHGKDFIITTEEGNEIPLQVKSSDKAAKRFTNHAKHMHRKETPVIVVKDDDTEETIMDRLIRLIRAFCESLRKEIERMKGRHTIREKERMHRAHEHHKPRFVRMNPAFGH